MDLTYELERLEGEIAELDAESCADLRAEYDRWGDVASAAVGTLDAALVRSLRPVTPRVQAAVAAALAGQDDDVVERVAMAAWLYLLAVVDGGTHPMAALLREPWEEHRRRAGRIATG